MTVGIPSILWSDTLNPSSTTAPYHSLTTLTGNMEREMEVTPDCPDVYRTLALHLQRELSGAPDPPAVINTTRRYGTALIRTTSTFPVVLRLELPTRTRTPNEETAKPIALFLPDPSDLVAWFRAFLSDIHKVDPRRVPHEPPLLSQPADWYTPEERELAERILQIERDVSRLNQERDERQNELILAGHRANSGIRQAIWADSKKLVFAAKEILSRLGFKVRDMDEESGKSGPKREDLRLTLVGIEGWEAMVEVKGSEGGTKTNDKRQIREHRERYIKEEGRTPDLTLWLSNPHRRTDPSSRPASGSNEGEAAADVGAVHMQSTDLYRQWALVAAGEQDAARVIESLVNAEPGLWIPPTSGSSD